MGDVLDVGASQTGHGADDSATSPSTGYRERMRTSSTAIWLLLGIAVLALLVSRLGRTLGPAGIVATVVVVIVIAGVARELQRYRSRQRGPDRSTTTKNVTPHEPALPPGPTASRDSAAAPDRPVIVIEPSDGSERLAAKLQALDRLRTDGLVTDEEYEAKRSRLIADF